MEFCSLASCIFQDSMPTKLSVFLTFFAKQWTFLDFFKCSTKSTNLCISFSVRTNFACKQYIFDYNTLWFSISSIPQPFFCSSISGQQPQIYYQKPPYCMLLLLEHVHGLVDGHEVQKRCRKVVPFCILAIDNALLRKCWWLPADTMGTKPFMISQTDTFLYPWRFKNTFLACKNQKSVLQRSYLFLTCQQAKFQNTAFLLVDIQIWIDFGVLTWPKRWLFSKTLLFLN